MSRYQFLMKRFLTPAAALLFLSDASLCHAQLPTLTDQPFLGYFTGIEKKRSRFGITTKGEGAIIPVLRNGEEVNSNNPIEIRLNILQIQSGDSVVNRRIDTQSLSSETPATLNPAEPVVFSGKASGDVEFAVVVSPERDGFSLSGKITAPGSTSPPPVFAVTLNFTPYRSRGSNAKAVDALMDKIKRDEIRIGMADRSSQKLKFDDGFDPDTIFPEGFVSATVKTKAYDDVEYNLEATGGSKLMFTGGEKDKLWNKFEIRWLPDPSQDPATQKLVITSD